MFRIVIPSVQTARIANRRRVLESVYSLLIRLAEEAETHAEFQGLADIREEKNDEPIPTRADPLNDQT